MRLSELAQARPTADAVRMTRMDSKRHVQTTRYRFRVVDDRGKTVEVYAARVDAERAVRHLQTATRRGYELRS
jgi:hypothetical protein